MLPRQPSSLGFQISNFLAKLYINIYHIKKNVRTIPSVVREIKSRQNFSGFEHANGPALESDILNFETLLHNFTSISTIFQNFRTIRPAVTENSSGQNFGRKKKKRKKRKKKNNNKKRSKNNKSPHFIWES